MSTTPRAATIYTEQLLPLLEGFPLWDPSPGSNQAPVDIADVGYVDSGGWIRLFNASKPLGDSSNDLGVPAGYQPLSVGKIRERACFPANAPIHSESIKHRTAEVALSGTPGVPMEMGGGFTFNCLKERGAVLILGDDGERRDAISKKNFVNYILEHHASWLTFAEEHGCDIGLSDLAFITGCDKSSSWTNASFYSETSEATVKFSMGQAGITQGGISMSWKWESCSSVLFHSYRPKNMHSTGHPEPPSSSGSSVLQNDTDASGTLVLSPRDQCLFLRGYKLCDKKTFNARQRLAKWWRKPSYDGFSYIPHKRKDDSEDPGSGSSGRPYLPSVQGMINAKAPRNPSSGSSGDGGSTSGGSSGSNSSENTKERRETSPGASDRLDSESFDSATDDSLEYAFSIEYKEPTHFEIVLDYILENSTAELALVHDDDLMSLLRSSGTTRDFQSSVHDISPKIFINNQVGMLETTYRISLFDDSPIHATHDLMVPSKPTYLDMKIESDDCTSDVGSEWDTALFPYPISSDPPGSDAGTLVSSISPLAANAAKDFEVDLRKVTEKLRQMPGLNAACSIVISIITTVNTSKTNNTRLRAFARSIVEQFLNIYPSVDHLDDIPHELKQKIDEFEAILCEVLKNVTIISSYSQLQTLLFADDSKKAMMQLEQRLKDFQTKAVAMGFPPQVHGNNGQKVHSGIQKVAQVHSSVPDNNFPSNFGYKTYAQKDILLLGIISRHTISRGWNDKDTVVTTLYRAEHEADGQAILVKQYQGPQDIRKFENDLAMYQRIWVPTLLQLEGWSTSTPGVPFQVYLCPTGDIEDFWVWARHTVSSNAVETIFGLYDMRISLKNLKEVERSQSIRCTDLMINSLVCIRADEDHLRFSLIYTGELEHYEDFDDVSYCRDYTPLSCPIQFKSDGSQTHEVDIDPSMPLISAFYGGSRIRFDDMHGLGVLSKTPFDIMSPGGSRCYRSGSQWHHEVDVDPAMVVVAAFCGGSKTWLDDLYGLELLPKGGFDDMDIISLGSVLLDRGWLGECFADILYGGNLGLGDVGYVMEDGIFEVVTNLHLSLVSRGGGSPRWTTRPIRGEAIVTEEALGQVLEYSGTQYKRYAHTHTEPHLLTHYDLRYTEIDQEHAWRILQHQALHIVETNGLSIAPHQLQLVTSITKYFTAEVHTISQPALLTDDVGAQDKEVVLDETTSRTTVYRFEEGEGFHMQESGVPEIDKKVYYSLHPILDIPEEVWNEGYDRKEVSDGYELYSSTFYRIHYLQLPPDVAARLREESE